MKSPMGSYDGFLFNTTAITWVVLFAYINVYPSGVDFEAIDPPIIPLAPPRLSITI